MEDQSAPIPKERTSELGGIICNLVQRTHLDQHGYLAWDQITSGLEEASSVPPQAQNRAQILSRSTGQSFQKLPQGNSWLAALNQMIDGQIDLCPVERYPFARIDHFPEGNQCRNR